MVYLFLNQLIYLNKKAIHHGQQSQKLVPHLPTLVHGIIPQIGSQRASADRFPGQHEEPRARVQGVPRHAASRCSSPGERRAHRQSTH